MNKYFDRAFKDGQSFYLKPAGCDEKLANECQKNEITLAFASEKQIRESYAKFDKESIDLTVAYYGNYKRGILDTMEKYPMNVPDKLKKLVGSLGFGTIDKITTCAE